MQDLSDSSQCPRQTASHSHDQTCLGGAAVRRRTRDRKVAGSNPGRGAIKSTRSTQPSIPPGSVNRVPACMAGVIGGARSLVSGGR